MILYVDEPVRRDLPDGNSLFLLHGFLGSGSNWRSIARQLESSHIPVCPDARNHGRSPHSAEMSYPLMASDLFDTADALGWDEFSLLGHSMGGKTAMEAALSRPDRISRLIVVDIAPKKYPPAMGSYLEGLVSLDLASISTRGQAMDALAEAVPDRLVRGFFLKNLERTGDHHFRWRLNLPAIHKNYPRIWEGIAPGRVYNGPVLFIRGEKSNYLQPQDEDSIRELFPRAEFTTIPGAGHWVHMDQPESLVKAVKNFLKGRETV